SLVGSRRLAHIGLRSREPIWVGPMQFGWDKLLRQPAFTKGNITMRLWTITTILGCGFLLGCEPVKSDRAIPTSPPPTSPAPDNTAVNKRDADNSAAKTPIDQNENKE